MQHVGVKHTEVRQAYGCSSMISKWEYLRKCLQYVLQGLAQLPGKTPQGGAGKGRWW